MSKKLLRLLQTLESREDRPSEQMMAQFVRLLYPEGEQVDCVELNYHLDQMLNVIKEMKNVIKVKKSQSYEGDNEEI